jgi:hypothetical protein
MGVRQRERGETLGRSRNPLRVLMTLFTVVPSTINDYLAYILPHTLVLHWMIGGLIALSSMGLAASAILRKSSTEKHDRQRGVEPRKRAQGTMSASSIMRIVKRSTSCWNRAPFRWGVAGPLAPTSARASSTQNSLVSYRTLPETPKSHF